MSLPYLQPYLGLSNGLNTLHAVGGPGGAVGGWIELGRSSGAVQLDVSSLPDKRYYMVLTHKPSGTVSGIGNYLNGDTGSNYSARYSNNGGADGTATSQTVFFAQNITFGNVNEFMVSYIANYSSKEKLGIANLVGGNTAGAGNAPQRFEAVSKWANTSNAINRIQTQGTMTNANSEMVVLGYDPADTHTNNFWEELYSGSVSSASQISTGTITAKKYLWCQLYSDKTAALSTQWRFNNDTANNYSYRISDNGGTDSAGTSIGWAVGDNGGAGNTFENVFIINNSANEKLVINHTVNQSTAGAGTAPTRRETVAKWANTSNQITEIDVNTSTSTFANAYLRVWGAD